MYHLETKNCTFKRRSSVNLIFDQRCQFFTNLFWIWVSFDKSSTSSSVLLIASKSVMIFWWLRKKKLLHKTAQKSFKNNHRKPDGKMRMERRFCEWNAKDVAKCTTIFLFCKMIETTCLIHELDSSMAYSTDIWHRKISRLLLFGAFWIMKRLKMLHLALLIVWKIFWLLR